MPRRKSTDIFKIDLPGTSIKARAVRAFAPVIQHFLGLELLNRHQEYCGLAPDPQDYMQRVFDVFRVRWSVSPQEIARIPKTGPLIIVANHPLGALEGMVLASLLLRVRPDAKLMVNYLLGLIPNLRDIFLFVDPFGGTKGTAGSLTGMKQSIRHLKDGGALGIFPSGEVSSFSWKTKRITDPAWNPIVARLARMTNAPVLPVFFEGRNTLLFQALGLIHPSLRTAWLAREMIARSGQRIGLRVGSVIPARRLAEFETDEKMIEFLRHRTYLLKHRPPIKSRKRRRKRRRFIRIPLSTLRRRAQARRPERIVDAVAPELLARDIASLPHAQLLTSNDSMKVYWAEAAQLPSVLREIGRLRELTFRATGEGTGKSIDLDQYDQYYHHLVVWNPERREVVASYRMGRTDEIIAKKGLEGLYTTTLFRYDENLLRRIQPALEMGRSFVREEYQRTFAPLLMLWRGICTYTARFPKYRYLYGPVSISNTYQTVSKALMIQFLRQHHTPDALADLVEPRNPFKPSRKIRRMNAADGYALFQSDDLTNLVADLEPDQKGIPVLLRQYLKMGAKLLAFNVDPDFGDCVDGLIVVDMVHEGLNKYFTKEDRPGYLAHHGATLKIARGA